MKRLLKRVVRCLGYEIRPLPAPAPPPLIKETTALEYELLRTFATRAAEMGASESETRALRYLYLTGILGPAPSWEERHIASAGDGALNVGIWRRESPAKDAAFIRRRDSQTEWHFWASRDRIEPKRRKWRIALLGESVARAYFFDPQFNLASALEGALASELGAGAIDVVDLAKSNLTLEQLRGVMGQCLTLQPDVLVVFAGNNWRPQLSEADIPAVETLVRTEGAPAMRSFFDTRTRAAVNLLKRQVNGLLERHRHLSVIWVIPEFNLTDWTDPITHPAHLVGQGDARWRELDRRAECALRSDDLSLAQSLAEEMIDLDGGTSSVAPRILAQCRRAAGDLPGERRYLEMCRDAEGWDPSFSYSPRVSSPIQGALREAASAARNAVVDLPAVLARHLDGALPNRSVFLDYCHLTAAGLQVATAAIAAQVLTQLTGRDVAPRMLHSRCPVPCSKIEGKAALLAAVHNSHFYQSQDVVQYWCARAVQLWPRSAQLMTRFIDCQTRRVPILACRSTQELFELDEFDTVGYLLRGRRQRLDITLSDAVARSVQAVGIDIGRTFAELRLQEHSTRTGPKELTEFFYSAGIPALHRRAWTSRSLANNGGSRCAFASAYWETSKFVFFGEQGRAVGLKLTYRLPSSSVCSGTVAIAINGEPLAGVGAGQTWQVLELSILGGSILEGINEISIHWPTDSPAPEQAVGRLADALVAASLPRFHRVFGEIDSLSVFEPQAASAHRPAAP